MKFNVAEGSGNARIAGWRPSRLGIAFEGIAIRLAGPELRVPNIMKRMMRWYDFGSGREATRSQYCEYGQAGRQSQHRFWQQRTRVSLC